MVREQKDLKEHKGFLVTTVGQQRIEINEEQCVYSGCVTFGRFNPVGVHDFGRARLESDKPSSNFIDKSSVSEIGDIQRSNLEASDNDNDSDLNASTSSISNADNMAVMELIRNILDKLTPFANMHLLASISKPINVA